MSDEQEEPNTFENVSKLVKDISALYLSNKFADVTFSLEGEKLHGHKVILAARSKYFENLLYGDSQGSCEAEITVGDVSPEAFQMLLKYIYTGRIALVPSKIQLILEVLGLAHQYSMKDSESVITQNIKHMLDLKNVWPVLNIANLYNLTDLREACHSTLESNASAVLADENSFNELTQTSVVNLLSRDSFFAPEIDIFKKVAKWCEQNKDTNNLVMKSVRLSQLSVVEIVSIVWPSKLVNCEVLLSAIAEIVNVVPKTTKSRGQLLINENLATPDKKAEVISGSNTSKLLTGNRIRDSYAYYPIDSGEQNGIVIKLGTRSVVNHIHMMLWDGDDRFYCYYIEVSTDQKHWKKVIDYRTYACRSYQNLYFNWEVAQYIRVLGTRNTRHHNQFHLVFFEIDYQRQIPRVVNGIVCPVENVATSSKKAVVIEGTNPGNLLENADGKKGYTYHNIGSGNITIQLAQPYLISSMKLRLWDNDSRFYKYYIETSSDKNVWETVIDRRNENCKSWQTLKFTERPVVFIRIIGTFISNNESNFHCFHFECPATEK